MMLRETFVFTAYFNTVLRDDETFSHDRRYVGSFLTKISAVNLYQSIVYSHLSSTVQITNKLEASGQLVFAKSQKCQLRLEELDSRSLTTRNLLGVVMNIKLHMNEMNIKKG